MGDLKAAGELGGVAASPPFANKMVRTTFLSCKHGDDIVFLLDAWMAEEALQA